MLTKFNPLHQSTLAAVIELPDTFKFLLWLIFLSEMVLKNGDPFRLTGLDQDIVGEVTKNPNRTYFGGMVQCARSSFDSILSIIELFFRSRNSTALFYS